MSVQQINVCDQCGTTYDERHPAWMTLTFPNVRDGDPTFDFCTYECLQGWVNEEEDAPVPNEHLAQAHQRYERLMETSGVGGASVAQLTPALSLAEAMAQGLKPGNPVFTRE